MMGKGARTNDNETRLKEVLLSPLGQLATHLTALELHAERELTSYPCLQLAVAQVMDTDARCTDPPPPTARTSTTDRTELKITSSSNPPPLSQYATMSNV